MMEYEIRRALEWEKEWIAQNNGHDWAYVGKNPVQICRKCKKIWWQAEKICPGRKRGRMQKMHSFIDSLGKLFVDCSECVRGGNGDRSCAAGARYKKPRMGGCFSGKMLEKERNGRE